MKKYGLQLRVQPSQKKQAARPPLPPPLGFRDDDDDDDNIEMEISRHAIKNKSLKDVSSPPCRNMHCFVLFCIILYSLFFFLLLIISVFCRFSRLRSSIRKLWKRIPLYSIMMEFTMEWKRKKFSLECRIAKRERYVDNLASLQALWV